jgi:hypothetical protein
MSKLREGRILVGTYFVLDWSMRILALVILSIAVAKGIFGLVASCTYDLAVCRAIQSLIGLVVNSCPFFDWLWFNGFPDVPAQQWYLSLVGPAGLCALFFFGYSFYLDRKRRKLRSILDDAEHQAGVERYRPSLKLSQSVSHLQAGGDIHIDQNQIIDERVRDWKQDFTNRPIVQIVIAAVGGVLAILLGKLLTGS